MRGQFLRGVAVLALLGTVGVGASRLAAQAPAPADTRTYVWWAELVSVDASARAVVAKAPIEAPVTSYVTRFKPGEKLLLTWIANGGSAETGPVLYVEKYDVTKASNLTVGYILPAEFLAADVNAKTITFKATVPDVAAFASVQPRQWMKVTSPMHQPTDTAAIRSVEGASAPAPFVRRAPGYFLAAEPVTAVASAGEFSRAMKAISAAFGATAASIQAKTYDDARAQLAVGLTTMKAVAAFWEAKQKVEPAAMAKDALAKMQRVDELAGSKNGIDLASLDAATKAVGGTCGACHTKYREQDPVTKAYVIKPGTL